MQIDQGVVFLKPICRQKSHGRRCHIPLLIRHEHLQWIASRGAHCRLVVCPRKPRQPRAHHSRRVRCAGRDRSKPRNPDGRADPSAAAAHAGLECCSRHSSAKSAVEFSERPRELLSSDSAPSRKKHCVAELCGSLRATTARRAAPNRSPRWSERLLAIDSAMNFDQPAKPRHCTPGCPLVLAAQFLYRPYIAAASMENRNDYPAPERKLENPS